MRSSAREYDEATARCSKKGGKQGGNQVASSSGAGIARPPVHRITLVQLAVLVPLCLATALVDEVRAYSLVAGGLVAVLPQAWFAAKTFRRSGATAAQAIARNSYIGEVGKFLLSAAGFALVFAMVRPISGLAVFVGFLAMLVIQILGSWWLLRRRPTE